MILTTITNALKLFEKVIFSIIVLSFVTLIIASMWERKKSDEVVNDVIISLSNQKYPENIIIEYPQQFIIKDVTKKYEIQMKDNNIFWGQIYRVKFDSGEIYGFYVDIGIFSKHKIKILNYHDK